MNILRWTELDGAGRAAALERAPATAAAELRAPVAEIISQVRAGGDAALIELSRRFDRVELDALVVPPAALAAAAGALEPALAAAIDQSIARIERFHRACAPAEARVETAPGVVCEQLLRPIETVGLYVPAGSAPLPSTTIMLGVPARLAGCPNVVLCSPPGADGEVDATVRAVATRLNIERVFRLGGAQAIAAMAYGTGSVPKCDKIFGPGNAWVTQAKLLVAEDPAGARIDLPAGPSEVMVVADSQADPEFVAWDLLSQAEHGADSQAILVTDSADLAGAVARRVAALGAKLPRAAEVAGALEHSRILLLDDLAGAAGVINAYAPEHLILQVDKPRALLAEVRSAGSVFVGPWAPESVGDYTSGTNHVLPTYGFARAVSGLSVDDFMTRLSVQELTPEGLAAIGPAARTLARAEGLEAHDRAVAVRLQRLTEKRP